MFKRDAKSFEQASQWSGTGYRWKDTYQERIFERGAAGL